MFFSYVWVGDDCGTYDYCHSESVNTVYWDGMGQPLTFLVTDSNTSMNAYQLEFSNGIWDYIFKFYMLTFFFHRLWRCIMQWTWIMYP